MRRAVAALPLAGSAAAARSQQQPRHQDDEFRVLVVGAGLGGCVCASELRKRFDDGGPTLRLSVWERATYCAGRFGARAVHGGRAVDLGSQVLSVVDQRRRAPPGHGVSAEASIAAFAEAGRRARAAETFDAAAWSPPRAPDAALAIGGAAGGLPAGAVVAGVAYDARTAAAFFFDDAGGALCANQPVERPVQQKLQTSLARSIRSRFG
ncbi:hypothetical protein SO694_00002346 [Aureococcus anophagefferens]|uniref:Uncharacterized protein n=1 Tax=Aureococcus anophagefferens TaxID=44056 RepID=A0ABR1GC51_AURAN